MTLETAKRIVAEIPQDKSVQFKHMLKNYSLIREAEAVLRGGMTYCEYEGDGGRAYRWIKVFPTATDKESSTDLAIKEYRKRKELRNRKNKIKEEPISSQVPVLQHKLVIPQINESKQKGSNPLSVISSKIKNKFDEFVKIMDGMVDE